MKRYFLFLFFLFCTSALKTNAQTDTAFWFVAPEVWAGHSDSPIYLRFASFDNPATISITQPANAGFPQQTVSLNANDAQSINLTNWLDIIENKPVNQILNYGIYISSTAPITAYYEEASTNNPDLISLKGKNALGTEFYTPFQNLLNSQYSQSKAGIDIVATEDNTYIEITPTQNLIGYTANTTMSINLNRGQTYSLRSASTLSYLRPSGTYISSDKPIAVTISDDSVNGISYYGGNNYDLLADQIIPVNKMGQEYIGIKGQLTLDDKIYITASEDNTIITSGDNILSVINAGESYELSLPNNAIYFSTSKPVIALHMTGYGSEICGAILPSINCTGSQNVSFIRSLNNPFFKLNILVKSGAEDDFLFNGDPNLITAENFSDVPNTNGEWKFASISNPSYVQILQNSNIVNNLDFFHVGIIMGRQSSSRYGYFSNYNTFSHEITSSSDSYCEGESLILSGENFPNLDFNWSGPNGFTANGNDYNFGSISQADSGIYVLTGDIGDCQVRSDTFHLSVSNLDDASFSVESFCQGSTNSATITGLNGGVFSLVNSLDVTTINPFNGELSNTTIGANYQIMYQTNGDCPNSDTQNLSVLPFEDASFTIDNFCYGSTNNAVITGVSAGQFSLTSNPNGALIDNISGELSNTTPGSIYTVEYTTPGSLSSCSSSSEQNVEVYSIPNNPNTTNLYEYCAGETINTINVLPQEQNSTIQWYSDIALSNLIIQSEAYQIPYSIGTTIVYVTETSENNCVSNPTPISQIINPLPNIYAGNDTVVCFGESIILNGSGGLNYFWNNGVQNNIPLTLEVGQYEFIVTADNINNCFNQDTIEVIIHANPNAYAGANANVCGLEYQLQANDNGNFGFWSSNNATVTSISSPTTNIINEYYGVNSFTWTETNGFGCESNSSVSINFLEQPNINILNDTTYGCEDESVFIEGGSTNASSFLWTTSGTGTFQNQNLALTEYMFSNEDLNNQIINIYLRAQLKDCYSSDTSLIILNKKPQVDIFSDETLCFADSNINLNIITKGISPLSYELELNDEIILSFSSMSEGQHSLLISDLGYYRISNLKDAFCYGENSEKFNLILRNNPQAEFTLYPRETSINEPTIYVNDQSLFANYYEWSFGDGTDLHFDMDTEHDYENAGNYNIKLVVDDEFGCTDSITKQVIIHPNFELFIPNSFTPDGDRINDTFGCKGYGISTYTISILNRWGELVFNSNDINIEWDGNNSINGVYAYRIDIVDMIGKSHYFEGEISLLR
ncbi:MAG: hypothetical protein CMP70_03845 [Flavobacteriales bacterium]|nr:hypothetical protein [Flavobacteriales bacterium]